MFQASAAVRRLSGGQRAKQLVAKPKDLIDLSIGDPDFGSPPDVRAAGKAAIDQGYIGYAPAMGDPELRKSVADYLSESSGGSFQPGEIFVTHGGTAAIYAVMAGYLDPGDEVMLTDPALSLYTQTAEQIGARSVMVPTDASFHLDVGAMERAVTPKTRVVVLVNPSNPMGTACTREAMDGLANLVQRHDLLLVSDETYDHILYDGRRHISAAEYGAIADRTILLNTVSKTFAMTGWRIGYLAGREELIRGPALIHRAAIGPINSVAQRAAVWAYSQTVRGSWRDTMLAELTRRRDLMVGLVNQTPGLSCQTPEGGIFLWVKADSPLSSEDLETACLEHGVAVRSGSEFGPRGEGYLRLSTASPPAVYAEGVRRIGEVVAASQARQDTSSVVQAQASD
jgi:aspartate/methionine/tyrosine aminotransferase